MTDSPFAGDPVSEVHLDSSPLVKVIAQVRFPVIAKIDTLGGVQKFQESLRVHYPVMRAENRLAFSIAPGVQFGGSPATLWRLSNASTTWSVTLAHDFVALETTDYHSRDDFLDKWHFVLSSLESLDPAPAVKDRIGIRYINRLMGPNLTKELGRWIKPNAGGLTQQTNPLGIELVANVTQSHYRINNLQLKASWGKLPPNAVIVPGVDAVDEESWVLDIDVFSEEKSSFSVDESLSDSRRAAEYAYTFFRGIVTDNFLSEHGAKSNVC